MNKTIDRYKLIGFTLLVLCMIALGANLTCLLLEVPIKSKVSSVIGLLGCASALYYMLHGYRKNAAPAYKAFHVILFVIFLLCTQTSVLNASGRENAGIFVTFASCLMASFSLCLAAGQNMGEKLSKTMALTIFVIAAVEMLGAILLTPGIVLGGSAIGSASSLRAVSNIVLARMSVAMTWAKYRDKAERGTR